ncbi:MAG: efflux RND transporter periplasmic adaptor subunit [Candidatus Gracilibacteria bacterium]|nr:efflux RND transporter periplasmic adaptor subunit [Candidatus Gracilibacteria bacterium]
MRAKKLLKKPSKKVVIILCAMLILGFGVKSFFFSPQAEGEKLPDNIDIPEHLGKASTAIAEKGDLEVNIKVLGKSKIVNEQELKFNQTGTITLANYKAGDSVKKGELLASMNKSDVYNEIEQAKLDLDNERIKYNKLLEDHDENNNNLADKIKDLKKKITNLESEIKELEKSQEKALFDKKVEIEKAKNDLDKQKELTPEEKDELKRTLEKKKKDLEEKIANKPSDKAKLEDDITKEKRNLEQSIFNYHNKIDTSILDIKTTNLSIDSDVKFFNNILGIRSDDLEGSYYSVFSNKNPDTKIKAEMNFRVALEKYDEVKEYTEELLKKENHTIDDLIETERRYRGLYEAMMTTADYVSKGLKETASTDMEGYTTAYKSSAESLRTSYQSKMTSTKTRINDLQNLDKPEIMTQRSERALKDLNKAYEDKMQTITDLEKEVKKLESSLSYDLSQKDISLEKATKDYEELKNSLPKFEREQLETFENKQKELRDTKKELEKAEKEYNETSTGPNKSDLLIAKNAVKQAKLKLENMQEKLDKYDIKAPFDGIIRTFDYKSGSKISDNASEKIVIENPNIIEIGVNLDQVDIVKVKKDQEVRIKFDAFPGKVYEGEMGDISGTPVEKYDGVSYEIKVLLKKDGDEVIYSGMTANVEIITDNKKDILLIPSTAIETNNEGETYVTVKNGDKKEKRKIEIGIANGKQTEVISGLKAGEEVVEVNFDANKFKDDEFGGGGMMGR